MTIIYAVGVIKADLSENPRQFIKDSRLWFLFTKFEDAEQCVLQNKSDIFEFYYNMAVIEEVHLYDPDHKDKKETVNYIPKQWWYKIGYANNGDSKDDVIEKTDIPKCMENTCCLWVG